MNGVADSLTRVTKPLRCTSLHQSISVDKPCIRSSSITVDSPVRSISPTEEFGSMSQTSSDDDSVQSDAAYLEDMNSITSDSFHLRRGSLPGEKKVRRSSSGNAMRSRYKLHCLNYTSPTTATRAMNDVQTKCETSRLPDSPEAEKAQFLAELPDAIARVRKVHYRRDAMLPKTKSFARVQKTLQEDNAPFEADVQKEATLARILQGKVVDNSDSILDRRAESLTRRQSMDSSCSTSPTGHDKFGRRFTEKEETLFTMEDINTSSPNLFASPFLPDKDIKHPVDRGFKTAKRKSDDGRYEPYSIPHCKRRAVSPSPSSPLGSPNVKGSIFRIEDLSL